MDEDEDQSNEGGAGRRLLVALAAIGMVVVGGAVGFALWPAPRGVESPPSATGAATTIGPPSSDIEAARKAVDGFAALPDYAPFWRRLVVSLPVEAAQARQAQAERWLADRAAATPERYLSETLRVLRQSRGVVAAKADPGPLGAVFEAQAALVEALAKDDPRLCVDFLYGGASDAFLEFAGRNRKLFAAMAEAFFAAILDGQAKKNERAAPTAADVDALEQGLAAAGLGKPAIDALLDGKAADPPLPDATMCEAGRTYLKTLRALPEDQRLRFYGLAVELMARS